ncbi:MAG: hypothetical protein ACREMO_01295, partial [Gemmatimonadales bacterium]
MAGSPSPPRRPELRLLAYLKPYRTIFILGMVATTIASVLDGFTVVILIPLFKHMFGTAGALSAGPTKLEAVMDRLLAPLLDGTTPSQ